MIRAGSGNKLFSRKIIIILSSDRQASEKHQFDKTDHPIPNAKQKSDPFHRLISAPP
jgi:hypothetical protein